MIDLNCLAFIIEQKRDQLSTASQQDAYRLSTEIHYAQKLQNELIKQLTEDK